MLACYGNAAVFILFFEFVCDVCYQCFKDLCLVEFTHRMGFTLPLEELLLGFVSLHEKPVYAEVRNDNFNRNNILWFVPNFLLIEVVHYT